MKRTIYIILLALLFNSCLDEHPSYTLNSTTAFTDVKTAQMALNGCYGQLTTYATYGQGIQEIFVGASGTSWAQTNDGDPDRYSSLDISSGSVVVKGFWTGVYKTISECNFFIYNLENSPLNPSDIQAMKAQAAFIRGLCYLNLYTSFGEVPLRNTPSTESTLNQAKASKEELIKQIEEDFTTASLGLGATQVDGRPSLHTARAYLAKLYWILACQDKDSQSPYWNKAKEYGQMVLDEGNYQLEPKFNQLFVNHVNDSKESIFQLNFSTTSQYSGNRGNWLFAPQVSTRKGVSWGRNRVNKSFHDWFVGTYPDDPRISETFLYTWINRNNNKRMYAYPYLAYMQNGEQQVMKLDYDQFEDPTNPQISELNQRQINNFVKATGNHNGWPFFKKQYDYESEAQNSNKNLILYRYADFLLMMADIENELGNTSKAVELANLVLERARNSGATPAIHPANWSPESTQEEIRTKIYRERLFELAGEPTMFLDARIKGESYFKDLLERHNNHHISATFATDPSIGLHKFKDRVFNNKNISSDFLKKNLRLPIPLDEINGNEALNSSDQNFGY